METRDSDLNFKSNNPGCSKYGNFINYYKFHPANTRIELLPLDIWNNFNNKNCIYCLDLGCNSGDLTQALNDFFTKNVCQNCKILGVDIDQLLIERAVQNNYCNNIHYEQMDFMNEDQRNFILGQYYVNNKINKFHIISCFSITMWIHLNHGDEGLKLFLKSLANNCEMLIVEPQPWKCYKTAVKRLKLGKEAFAHFDQLKIRENVEDVIEAYLVNCCKMTKIGESQKRNDWKRKIIFFYNNC